MNGGTTVAVGTTLDPTTGDLDVTFAGPPNFDDPHHPSPYADILPPDVTSPEGEGYVRFSVRVKSDAATGTVIDEKATITFDEHEQGGSSLDTNHWSNLVGCATTDAADLDGDGVGDACDETDAAISLNKVRVGTALQVRGTFVTHPGTADQFDASRGITVQITDAINLDAFAMWSAQDCVTNQKGQVRCASSDRLQTIVVKPNRHAPGQFAFDVKMRKLAAPAPFAGPVTVDVAQGDVLAGLDRVGSLTACSVGATTMTCRGNAQ